MHNNDVLKARRKCVNNEYQHAEAHLSLKISIQGIDRTDMIVGYTEGYFSALDDAGKRWE